MKIMNLLHNTSLVVTFLFMYALKGYKNYFNEAIGDLETHHIQLQRYNVQSSKNGIPI